MQLVGRRRGVPGAAGNASTPPRTPPLPGAPSRCSPAPTAASARGPATRRTWRSLCGCSLRREDEVARGAGGPGTASVKSSSGTRTATLAREFACWRRDRGRAGPGHVSVDAAADVTFATTQIPVLVHAVNHHAARFGPLPRRGCPPRGASRRGEAHHARCARPRPAGAVVLANSRAPEAAISPGPSSRRWHWIVPPRGHRQRWSSPEHGGTVPRPGTALPRAIVRPTTPSPLPTPPPCAHRSSSWRRPSRTPRRRATAASRASVPRPGTT